MHELSLAQGLLAQLTDLAATHKATRILTVRVSIGAQSGIVCDSFVFGFNAIRTAQKLTGDAVLEIHEVDGPDLVLTQVEME